VGRSTHVGAHREIPVETDSLTRLVLASVLATKVNWAVPFDLEEAGYGGTPALGKAASRTCSMTRTAVPLE